MGRKEDLLRIVEANRQKREQADQQWGEARDKVIKPRLEIAAKSLQGIGHWSVKRDNGGISLSFESSEYFSGGEFSLSFSLDRPAGKIICHCSVKDIKESFDVENLTMAEVDRKIDEFVRAVT